ncbi:MAG TPA: DUF92 domain-containing protein [Gemmatimonadales bacterium]|nr:DUF92 domain-containing protein [Gemmatimonadales bacterium]
MVARIRVGHRAVNAIIAAALALALALLGGRLRWLAPDGVAAAAVVGAAVFWGGGLRGALLLSVFFVSGSMLTMARERRPRTARQVLANGAVAGLASVLLPLNPERGWLALAGGLAAAQADTWATEIGAYATRPPRLITTWAPVPAGTSGAVTLLGTVAGTAGAAVTAAILRLTGATGEAAMATFAAGVIGMLIDSLAGATVQASYRCPSCGATLEHSRDGCGAAAVRIRGVACVDNDAVNLIATIAGAATAMLSSGAS